MTTLANDKDADAPGQPAPTRLSRTLHAPRATVFKAWSSADSVKQWFAPQPYTVPEAKVELRVGGAFDICMRSPAGELHWTRGTFVEVEADRRLVIEMRITGPDGALAMRARTAIDFSDALGGTRLDVTQSYEVIDPAAAGPMLAGAPIGWGMTLDQLERRVVEIQGGGEAPARSVVHAMFDLQRTYDAPVSRVWAALTDEAAKQKWFAGPAGQWEMLERYMDVRPGGLERLTGRWEGGMVSQFDAVYHDVIAGERLVYSYEMRLDGKKISVSLATMQLKDAGGGKTTLMVTEQGAFLDGYDDAGSREHGTGLLLEAIGASLSD